jgi:hypothetical protein
MEDVYKLFASLLLALALMVALPQLAFAQINVSGQVLDAENDSPMPGVSVQLQGTGTGTVTDADGNYSIDVPSENSVLVFSFISYETEEIQVGNQQVIDVRLILSAADLEEVVVVGYGTVRKSDLTGSVSSVNGEDLNTVSQTSVDQILQGRGTHHPNQSGARWRLFGPHSGHQFDHGGQ